MEQSDYRAKEEDDAREKRNGSSSGSRKKPGWKIVDVVIKDSDNVLPTEEDCIFVSNDCSIMDIVKRLHALCAAHYRKNIPYNSEIPSGPVSLDNPMHFYNGECFGPNKEELCEGADGFNEKLTEVVISHSSTGVF